MAEKQKINLDEAGKEAQLLQARKTFEELRAKRSGYYLDIEKAVQGIHADLKAAGKTMADLIPGKSAKEAEAILRETAMRVEVTKLDNDVKALTSGQLSDFGAITLDEIAAAERKAAGKAKFPLEDTVIEEIEAVRERLNELSENRDPKRSRKIAADHLDEVVGQLTTPATSTSAPRRR